MPFEYNVKSCSTLLCGILAANGTSEYCAQLVNNQHNEMMGNDAGTLATTTKKPLTNADRLGKTEISIVNMHGEKKTEVTFNCACVRMSCVMYPGLIT